VAALGWRRTDGYGVDSAEDLSTAAGSGVADWITGSDMARVAARHVAARQRCRRGCAAWPCRWRVHATGRGATARGGGLVELWWLRSAAWRDVAGRVTWRGGSASSSGEQLPPREGGNCRRVRHGEIPHLKTNRR
jgi:hypothetical protein